MAPNEGYPQSGAGPEDLRRQRQAETVERLSSLVSDYGLDPGIAAEYSSDTTTIYVYPGMEPALGDRLDELKAQSVEELHGLCQEAYRERFDSPRAQQQVASFGASWGRTGSQATSAWPQSLSGAWELRPVRPLPWRWGISG
jgi:hypothetical protein